MARLLRVGSSESGLATETTMVAQGFAEATHLEQWIVDHPEVIDESLMIVATQFDQWESNHGTARERLDVLALSSSGETVVMELKRAGDRKIHLQALTYGALVAGFDRHMLAAAHAQWAQISQDDALQKLTEHLEADWDADILKLPRLVLVAERFPDQVLTTVQWLAETAAPGLEIECHEYSLFTSGPNEVLAAFQKRFPVEDIDSWRLRPAEVRKTAETRKRIDERTRRARSVPIIRRLGSIPEGAHISLEISRVNKGLGEQVDNWLADGSPARRTFQWHDSARPLLWEQSGSAYTPTGLVNEVIRLAGQEPPSISGPAVLTYEGKSLAEIAEELIAKEAEAVD